MTKQYAERDPAALGDHYFRHVEALTAEGLYSKSAIAAELAWRDLQIQRLRHELEAARAALENLGDDMEGDDLVDLHEQLADIDEVLYGDGKAEETP